MKTISLALVIALLAIGIAVNLIWHSGYGYIPLGIYLVLWLVGAIRNHPGQ